MRPSRIGHLVVVMATLMLPSVAQAQQTGGLDPETFRQRVAAFLASEAPRPLPPGDTLLTWHDGGPVLFHTASRDSGGVQAGMLRADRMVGTADVRWQAGQPTRFTVRWFTPTPTGGGDSVVVTGLVLGGALHIQRAGAPDTALAVPVMPWAGADYGMEELLLPLFDGPPWAEPRPVAILRPYGLRWDTVAVTTAAPAPTWMVARWTDEKGERWSAAMDRGGHRLLWVRRSRYPTDEKLPLARTPLGAEYERLRSVLEPATRP